MKQKIHVVLRLEVARSSIFHHEPVGELAGSVEIDDYFTEYEDAQHHRKEMEQIAKDKEWEAGYIEEWIIANDTTENYPNNLFAFADMDEAVDYIADNVTHFFVVSSSSTYNDLDRRKKIGGR